MPRPIARWNPARDVWETETTGLFCEHSDVFSETWPSSGTTRAGTAYEQPTSAPLTDGSVSSSLLPTPVTEPDTGNGHARNLSKEAALLPTPDAYEASRGGSQHPDKRKAGNHSPYLASVVEWTLLPTPTATPYGSNQSPSPGAAVRPSLDTLAPTLLPTPRATDGTKGGPNQPDANLETRAEAGPNLHNAVMLLPTPRASDGPDASSHARSWSTTDRNLHTLVKLGELSTGASTNPPSAAGKPSPADQPQHQPSPEREADSA